MTEATQTTTDVAQTGWQRPELSEEPMSSDPQTGQVNPTETLVVQFENKHHQNLHRVLMDAGFTFGVDANLHIGRRYVHPKKPIKITLQEDGGNDETDQEWLDCKVEYQGDIQVAEKYSVAEWNWLTSVPNTPDGEVEMLKRELHILLNMRPRFMTAAQIEMSIVND